MKRRVPLTMIALLSVTTSACSYRQVYEGLQASQRQQCQKLSDIERTRCLESANTGYDEYRRERDKARTP